jgi:hypothetical protein
VRWSPAPPGEPNASATENGARLLDDYLSSHFRVEKKDGYELLLRN